MKRNSKQATQPPKKPKVKSPWCLSDEEKADSRTIDHQALARAREMEKRMQGSTLSRRINGTTVITGTPSALARFGLLQTVNTH